MRLTTELPNGIPFFSIDFSFFNNDYEFIFNYNTKSEIYFVNIYNEFKEQIAFNAPLVNGSDLLQQTDINAILIYESNNAPNLKKIEGFLVYQEL